MFRGYTSINDTSQQPPPWHPPQPESITTSSVSLDWYHQPNGPLASKILVSSTKKTGIIIMDRRCPTMGLVTLVRFLHHEKKSFSKFDVYRVADIGYNLIVNIHMLLWKYDPFLKTLISSSVLLIPYVDIRQEWYYLSSNPWCIGQLVLRRGIFKIILLLGAFVSIAKNLTLCIPESLFPLHKTE